MIDVSPDATLYSVIEELQETWEDTVQFDLSQYQVTLSANGRNLNNNRKVREELELDGSGAVDGIVVTTVHAALFMAVD